MRTGHPQIGGLGGQAHRGQIYSRIILLRGIHKLGARHFVAGACQQGVAVGLGRYHALRSHHACGARHVLDHDGGVQLPGQYVPDHAADHVDRAARGIANHDADGLAGIGILCLHRACEQAGHGTGDAKSAGKSGAVWIHKFHNYLWRRLIQ